MDLVINPSRISTLRRILALERKHLKAIRSMQHGFCLGVLLLGFATQASAEDGVVSAAPAVQALATTGQHQFKRANFKGMAASQQAHDVADWVVDSGDHQGMSFVIVDKTAAQVFVFGADGLLRGNAAALLGLAVGDDAVPDIGTRKLSSIRPDERTTPAGRFVASLDRNLHGGEILWVDYDTSISMHPVVTNVASERRAERLATPSPLDNRISYGCINVPADFFQRVVHPAFKGAFGVVYVLPETRSAQSVFASYDVSERERLQLAGQHLATQVATHIPSSEAK